LGEMDDKELVFEGGATRDENSLTPRGWEGVRERKNKREMGK